MHEIFTQQPFKDESEIYLPRPEFSSSYVEENVYQSKISNSNRLLRKLLSRHFVIFRIKKLEDC